MQWHKSTYSDGTGNNCVEVAETPRSVLVRDTQRRDLGPLAFPPEVWASFVEDVKADRL